MMRIALPALTAWRTRRSNDPALHKPLAGNEEKAWELANRIDSQGAAEVWCGPLEQAELYHQQLQAEGLTMAPLERC